MTWLVSPGDQREELVQAVLGMLHHGIVGIARHRKRLAHDLVQALGLGITEQLSLPQKDGETQDTVERSDIERLLRFE